MRALIISCMPVRLPRSGEMKHGEDFVMFVPPKASEAGKFASIKHGTFTKYAVLHRQGPPLRASSTQQTVCPPIAFQFNLEREMNYSCYVL